MGKQQLVDGSMALNSKKVIVIEAKEEYQPKKLRVAAYARVSSDSRDQLNSYAVQTSYFTDLITRNGNWQLAGIYADSGITGTSIDKREDFLRMLSDCRRGLIDRIITKSISRFARNTKECLTVIRELKSIGIGIYFEEQKIDTAKVTGEMLTAVFAGLAQAESQSISKNMRWSYEKRMSSGEFNTCKNPFGFRLKDGSLEVYEPEAEIVRMIFQDYLSGMSCEAIAKKVTETGTLTRDGRKVWGATTISYILTNERYIGNALLQKKYTTSSFPPEKKRNKGAAPQYYVSESNPPIIDTDSFIAAKGLLEKRSQAKRSYNRTETVLTKKIRCGSCGAYAKRTTNAGKPYWVCYKHFRSANNCPVSQVSEEEIKNAFLRLCYKLQGDGNSILKELASTLTELRNRRMLWSADIIELNIRISDIMEQDRQLSELNSLGLADPDFYIQQKNELTEQLRAAKVEKERLISIKEDDTLKQTNLLSEAIESMPHGMVQFDEDAFTMLVKEVLIEKENSVVFRLKNGVDLREKIERGV